MEDSGKWDLTTDRFVAFFDIMGFKDLVGRKSHEEIVKLLDSLSQTRTKLEGVNNRPSKEGKAMLGETRSFTFSDSIIFFSKGSTKKDANKIIVDCFSILRYSLKNQIPIKGAISFGRITLNQKTSVYFGQPIIDAYLLHDELCLYSLIADNSFENQINILKMNIIENFFEFYPAPLKSGKAFHHILKPLSSQKDEAIINLKLLYGSVAGKPRQYIDNTLEFLKKAKYPK